MELDDAILREDVMGHRMTMMCPNSPSCGLEHMQLAEWLKELKERREKDVASFSAFARTKKWAFRVRWLPRRSRECDTAERPLSPDLSVLEDFVTTAVQDCDAWNALINHFHAKSEWFAVERMSSEPA